MATKTTTPTKGLVFNESNHRYRLDGKSVRGVTGLIGAGTPKDALIAWAAEQAGLWALDHLDDLQSMPPKEALRRMKWAHRDVRDAAGIKGTAVHGIAQMIHETGEADVDDEHMPFITGYLDFLDEWEITPVLAERPCGNRTHWYAGTFDLLATSPKILGGALVQIDLKTSKRPRSEVAMQTAAYARAEFYTDPDGTEHPMPEVHGNLVAHVTPTDRDGEHERYGDAPLGTSLYMLAPDQDTITEHFGWFQAAAYTAKMTGARDRVIGDPLTPQTAHAAAA